MNTPLAALMALFREHDVYPERLAASYPHVLVHIAEAWGSRAEADDCFAHLMLADQRRHKGFPPAAMSEIFRLASLHDRLYPPQASPFDFWQRSLEATGEAHHAA